MQHLEWDEVKNAKLKAERGVCFEDVQTAIEADKVHNDINHPYQKRYPGQKLFVVEIDHYIFIVPYIEKGKEIFLKTIYPSRKFTKKYLP